MKTKVLPGMKTKALLVFVFFQAKIFCQEQYPCMCDSSSDDQTKNCKCNPVDQKSYLLSLDDEQLYNLGLDGIGQCRIQRNTGAGFCDLYVKSGIKGEINVETGSSYTGYPLSRNCRGTGCVKAPDFPKSTNVCWYSSSDYSTFVNSREEYCSDNGGIANAAAQLRDAIYFDACNCTGITYTTLSPPQIPSPPPQADQAFPCMCDSSGDDQTKNCKCNPVDQKSYLLSLGDEDLYNLGVDGIGQCRIQRNTGGGFCDLYVKSGVIGGSLDAGYPLSRQCQGTGCVKAPDFPKGVNTCWYSSSQYSTFVNSRVSDYCSNNGGIANAVEQLRDAIQSDACNCTGIHPPNSKPPANVKPPLPLPHPRFFEKVVDGAGEQIERHEPHNP